MSDLGHKKSSSEASSSSEAVDGWTVRKDYPVFILGSARSGTSTIACALKEHFEYDGHAEGHMFSLLYKLMRVLKLHYVENGFSGPAAGSGDACLEDWIAMTTVQFVGHQTIETAIKSVFRQMIQSTYRPRWFEKTPGPAMIEGVPIIAKMYPNARYIYLIREPVSNIESRMRKFPDVPFEAHCAEWTECAVAWLRAKQYLPHGSYVEIITHDLDRQPQAVFERIAKLLGTHPLPRHVRQKPLPARFQTVERTSPGSLSAGQTLSGTNWTAEQKQRFLASCGAMLETYGFQTLSGSTLPRAQTLSPPCGQRDVETVFGQFGGIWPQIHRDALWIFMHPSAPGAVTKLTYKHVTLDNVGAIATRLAVISPNAPVMRFTLSVISESTGEELASEGFLCKPEEEVDVTLHLPQFPTEGCKYTLTITSESATDSIVEAWALAKCPQLLPRDSVPSSAEEAGREGPR